ncbi:GTPase activator protein [Oryctes borbonicus]|uniref:GTPase activator protein n=1 Tax=Oryctes borbonicus TaxID=1629725 RepID=A0A0T6B2Q1_9SCAR|nr:GTPase activator protein [Oryctes borbonicus]
MERDRPRTGSVSSVSSEKSDQHESLRPLKLTPAEIDDHNRTMVLQVDRTDLRLISPDRKGILLHKHHKDVTTCVQGQIHAEYFGFIAKENGNTNTFIGFVFKCESASVASEAVGAIMQAFNNAETRAKPIVTSCDHCPMVWFHKLCCEVENLSDKKTQIVIFRKIEQLDDDEQMVILTKFRGAETDSVREQNEFLMMLLRAHCEMKQGRHVHDTAENRSEFLNQYLGGGNTIFMKAKRSLTTSFDNLLKRKASRDDFNPALKEMTLPLHPTHREASPNATNESDSEESISRSSTAGSHNDLRENHTVVSKEINIVRTPDKNTTDKTPKSPMLDIFLKVGSSPKTVGEDNISPTKQDMGSWRQAIFKRVVTPNKVNRDSRKRSREELKDLWKKSIHQAVLLIRMEKENAKLRARQEETAVKRIKLEYDEMRHLDGAEMEVWELITHKDPSKIKCDNKILMHAIKQGIPRGKRGEVWQFLAEQFCTRIPPIDLTKHPNYNIPYETLLKQLTSHQHAILIDLGRTFPCHSYFSSPLGPGQLALFNLLKAYSLLDPDVGYCQGLSFVAGVLLLHMEESQAFFLLRHLMFRRGLRKQYLPDMVGLQIRLYQLSRLLHDQLPELYNHFDLYEVAPTLYAAPWLLTIFASQFPLGFVTRVFGK